MAFASTTSVASLESSVAVRPWVRAVVVESDIVVVVVMGGWWLR